MRAKNILQSLLIILLLAGIIYSQPQPPSPRQKLKHLKEKLELSDEQAKKIETILKTSDTKMKALHEKMEASHDEAMDEMDNIISAENKEIEKVLTDAQKKEYLKLKKETEGMRLPMGDKQGPPREGNQPPPPPPGME
jgi:hypothetical protein